MPNLSPALDADIWVIQGESDMNAVFSALSDWKLAQSVALALETHSVIRLVAALSDNLLARLNPLTISDPALRDARA